MAGEVVDGSVKFCMQSPADRFRPLISTARAVLFAGGTMHPVSHVIQQLLPDVAASRIDVLTCSHVIPAENVLTLCVPRGPANRPFLFSFKQRDEGMQVCSG
jgi:chromosome transmission fidelity protein 1